MDNKNFQLMKLNLQHKSNQRKQFLRLSHSSLNCLLSDELSLACLGGILEDRDSETLIWILQKCKIWCLQSLLIQKFKNKSSRKSFINIVDEEIAIIPEFKKSKHPELVKYKTWKLNWKISYKIEVNIFY